MTVLYYDMQNVDEWAKKWKALLDGINEGNQMESAKLSELKSAVGFPSGPTLINTTIPAPGTSITIGTTPVKK
jgi:uridine phosphorylase